MLQGKRAALAHLYYLSNSVQFGSFEFAIHRDDPSLPLSPNYLHYPKPGEPGSELLPALYVLAADLFYELLEREHIGWDRLAGVPKGAMPLAEKLAVRLEPTPERGVRSDFLLRFRKEERPSGATVFTPPPGIGFVRDDQLLLVEDHTSGGRNKKLMCQAAEAVGLKVDDILTVVDRQQGGVAAMAAEGVQLHSLLTLDDLLDFGLEQAYIEEEMAERVRFYIAANQFYPPPEQK